MKRKDVMITVLSEVSGKSKEEVERTMPPQLLTAKMEEELSDEEAEKQLTELRKEKAGILNWMLAGFKRRVAESN